ncbi:oxidoreductase, partial [Curtobacterium sp. P97]|nr:oxidoreductase [Curtobacterium sp. P97]
ALAAAGHEVVAAAGLSAASRDRAARLLPGVPLLPTDEVVAAADLVVLAVPDDALPGLVAGLAETGVWRRGQLTFHTSGAHGLAVLAPAAEAGVLGLALHPAMTFSGGPEDATRLSGSPFGVTSRPEHRAVAETVVLE